MTAKVEITIPNCVMSTIAQRVPMDGYVFQHTAIILFSNNVYSNTMTQVAGIKILASQIKNNEINSEDISSEDKNPKSTTFHILQVSEIINEKKQKNVDPQTLLAREFILNIHKMTSFPTSLKNQLCSTSRRDRSIQVKQQSFRNRALRIGPDRSLVKKTPSEKSLASRKRNENPKDDSMESATKGKNHELDNTDHTSVTIDSLSDSLSDSFREECELQDVRVRALLGIGAYGKVWLAHDKKTNQDVALKTISKKQLIDKGQVQYVLREKNIMSSIDHPFILRMESSSQDTKHLYFKLPVMKGGDLFSRIHTQTSHGLPKTSAAFYSSCVLDALYYLHGCNIAHRDLKPENVLIDDIGYCRIMDFGFARIISQGEKCTTTCGTQEYMSPELIMGKGHSWSVDCWAFGVMLHEMLVGKTPFHSKSPLKMMKKVVTLQAKYPKNMDKDGRDLVQSLLKMDPNDRSDHDMKIKKHPFYKSINWDALVQKEIQAPWVPGTAEDPVKSALLKKYTNHDIIGLSTELSGLSDCALSDSDQSLFVDF